MVDNKWLYVCAGATFNDFERPKKIWTLIYQWLYNNVIGKRRQYVFPNFY